MIVTLRDILTQIHVFHLSTETFSAHKISDQLKTALDPLVDKIMEVSLSKVKDRSKIDLSGGFYPEYLSKDEFVKFLDGTVEVYTKLRKRSKPEIQMILDDFIAETEKAVYLLSFE